MCKIGKSVKNALKKDNNCGIIVFCKKNVDTILNFCKNNDLQHGVLKRVNAVVVCGVDQKCVDGIANIEDTKIIIEDIQIDLDDPKELTIQNSDQKESNLPTQVYEKNRRARGLDFINAPYAWKKGYNGKGTTVCIIDTGVDHMHESLSHNWLGQEKNIPIEYTYFDSRRFLNDKQFIQKTAVPCDEYTHGTHVAGIICGTNDKLFEIGVAPGAKWIAVRAGGNGYTILVSLVLAAYEWILDMPDQYKPSVINQSFGTPIYNRAILFNPNYENYLLALNKYATLLYEKNILIVNSAGNSDHESAGLLASLDLILSVGALNHHNNRVASYSSKGPNKLSETCKTFPDISAPGTYTLSSCTNRGYSGQNYCVLSGTSMSAPTVTGVVAVVKQILCDNNLDCNIDTIKDVIINSARKDIYSNGDFDSYPNNFAGNGCVDLKRCMYYIEKKFCVDLGLCHCKKCDIYKVKQ